MKKTLMVLGVMVVVVAALAAEPLPDGGPYEETVDGITWTYMITDGVASVGTGKYHEPAISIYTQNSVEIPAVLGGCPVRTISNFAFAGCLSLSVVTIPNGVTDVGNSAFDSCGMWRVDIPDSVTRLGAGAFSACASLEWISIPAGVTNVGDSAFANCTRLSRVDVSTNVTHVGGQAFAGCGNIDGVYISDMAAWCGIKFDDANSNPLYYAKKLYVNGIESGPEIPNGVKDIGSYSFCGHWFEGCSLTIPSSVTNIGKYAFSECVGLTGATISDGMPSIAEGVFYGCCRMTEVTIPASVKSIGNESFCYCGSLSSVTIPEGTTNIGAYAFAYCISLSTLSIPASVINIDCGAFYECQGLGDGVIVVDGCALTANGECPSDVVLPDGVRLVAGGAFMGSAVERIVMPSSVKSVGRDAFNWCSNLRAMDFECAPPCGLEDAGIAQPQYVAVRYNVEYQDEWLPVIEACGFENARPYDPHAPTVSKVIACQRYPWNGKVDIDFELSETGTVSRSLFVCAVDRESGIANIAEHVAGDMSYVEGKHRVVWDMAEDSLTTVSTNIAFGVAYVVDSTEALLDGAGWSELTNVDLTDGIRAAKKIETLTYSTEWMNGLGEDATAVVAVNGQVISERSGSGTVEWKPMRDGTYELTHTIVTNGVTAGESATAVFLAEDIGPKQPVISPASGSTFDYSLTVTMTCESEGATIHYTTDGTTPTMESSTYKKFRIYERTVVKAIAFYEDGVESKVSVAEYAPGRCENPIIRPSDGSVFQHSGQRVSIAWTGSNGVLRVTTDGSEPTKESPEYEGSFTIDDTTTIKAKVFSDTWFDSAVVTATLTRVWEKVATPEIAAAETFTGSKNKVTISSATEGAAIYYTLDGDEPTTISVRYEKPFCVTGSCTVKAMAVRDDYIDSDVATRSVTREWSIGETMGKCDHTFATSGELGFVRTNDLTAALGESMRSGAITNCQTSILSTVVVGPGTLSFKWKTSCEEDYPLHEWDHAEFVLDGIVTNWLDGITDWVVVSQRIEGDGEHAIIWRYVKDTEEKEGEDCLWVSEYSWTSDYTETQTTSNPVPYDWLTKKCCDVVDEYDSYESVVKQKALNPRFTVEQCYVAGLDPESITNEFAAAIEMIDSVPRITWSPDLETERTYKIWGSTNLVNGGEWEWPTNALHRFFKVTVEMP